MPPFPGEERLVTVFADCHYYFAQPTVRPVLHRFDKASYFYIYYNSTRHTCRIEIANNPGTSEQDAFNGYLDTCRIINSSRFPTLLTFIVDDITPKSPTSPKTGRDPEEWRLSSADPRDPIKMKYRIHTLDVYLWAQEDATLVTEALRKLLLADQLEFPDIESEPEPEPARITGPETTAHPMSPVVQNLEHMAVSDPEYNGQHRNLNPQNQTAISPVSSFASHNLPPPPPPPGGAPQAVHSPSPALSDLSHRQSAVDTKQQSNFTPMAYNPAAPPAPEPIAHREKTPPPEDGSAGTGLTHAMQHDQGYVPGPPAGGYQIGQGPPNTFGGGYGGPPPQQPGYNPHHQGFSSPPPPPPQSSTAAYSVSPQSQFSPVHDQRGSVTSNTPSFGPPPTQPENQRDSRHSVAAETYIPASPPQQPIVTPGSQFYQSLPGPGAKPLAHVQPQYPDYLSSGGPNAPAAVVSPPPGNQGFSGPPGSQPPIGGYSTYDYRTQSQSQSGRPPSQGQANPYDVHSQLYRPTEAEMHSHGSGKHRTSSSHGSKLDKTDSRTGQIDKKVGGWLSKVQKRIG